MYGQYSRAVCNQERVIMAHIRYMIYDLDCLHLNFSDLRNLFLGANQISEIPSEIKAFKRLKVLYLGGNSLTQLPAEICQLQRLQALILAQNKLKSLPNCICNLKKLETLQLHQVNLATSSQHDHFRAINMGQGVYINALSICI